MKVLFSSFNQTIKRLYYSENSITMITDYVYAMIGDSEIKKQKVRKYVLHQTQYLKKGLKNVTTNKD